MVDCCVEYKIYDEFSGGQIVENFKNSYQRATPPSFNIHSLDVTPHVFPYGLSIVAVPMAGFWLIVICEPALGLAAAMLAATYQK